MVLKIVNQSKRRQRARSTRKFIFFLVFGLIFSAAAFIALDKKFQISEIAVSGANPINSQKITEETEKILEERKFFIFSRKDIFLTGIDDLVSRLQKQFAIASEISISRDFWRKKLEIAILEREKWAVWCWKESCFYADSSGVIFREAPQFSGNLVLKILDQREEPVTLGSRILDENLLNKLQNFIKTAAEKQKITINSIEIYPDLLFKLVASDGWKIILDSQTDIKLAIENFPILIGSAIKDRLNRLDYIDLRFPDKSFFKLKN
jgi:cell division septal protein FtsQ